MTQEKTEQGRYCMFCFEVLGPVASGVAVKVVILIWMHALSLSVILL